MQFNKHILVYAENPAVRRTKQLVLESAGYSVIAVGTMREVEYVASRTIFDLVVLGRTVHAENKRFAAQVIKQKLPTSPILEICDLKHCVDNPDYVLQTSNPEDLMAMVNSIFGAKDKRTT
jgi:DNA-binding response OmpR family regulator